MEKYDQWKGDEHWSLTKNDAPRSQGIVPFWINCSILVCFDRLEIWIKYNDRTETLINSKIFTMIQFDLGEDPNWSEPC